MSSESVDPKVSAGASTATLPQKAHEKRSSKGKPRPLPPYHVILLDDSDHSHEYVVEMMTFLFGYPTERGYQIALEVDTRKRAIVFTTHKELAELKRDQIHAYGVDVRVASCAGSMSACIMPAEA